MIALGFILAAALVVCCLPVDGYDDWDNNKEK